MGANTKISWTDHSFSPWWGCTKVSAGCDNCYAQAQSERFNRAKWGHGEPRWRTSDSFWRQPLKWDRAAARDGIRYRVFCSPMSDWADHEVPDEWRRDLFRLIDETPHLEWLLLSKRHILAYKYLPQEPMPNVRVGFTVENQGNAEMRLPRLAVLGLHGWKTFVSYEPAIGPVNFWPWLDPEGIAGGCIGWIICGAESGHGRRHFNEDWARSVRDGCNRAGVPFLYKQKITPDGKKIELPELDGEVWAEVPA